MPRAHLPDARQDHHAWFNREKLVGVEHNPGPPTNGRYGYAGRNRGRGGRRSDTDPRRFNVEDAEAGALAASFTATSSAPTSGALARPWLTPDKSLSQLAEAINMSMLSPAFRTLSAVVSYLRDHPDVLSFTVDGSFVYPSGDAALPDNTETIPPPTPPARPTAHIPAIHATAPAHDPPLATTQPRHKQTLAESLAAFTAMAEPHYRKRFRSISYGEPPAHTPSMDRPLAPQPHATPPAAAAAVTDHTDADVDDAVDSLMREFAHDAAHPRRNIRERAPNDTPPNPYADLSPSDLEDHRLEIEHLIQQARAAQAARPSPPLPR